MTLGPLRAPVAETITALEGMQLTRRLWERDPSLWSADPEQQHLIANRLGWLDSIATITERADELEAFATEVRDEGFSQVVLLGMGGSSLAPEVLRATFGVADGMPDLVVLDSTDPAAIRDLEDGIDPERTLFIASSKSGTTTETLAFLEYFWSVRPQGRQFVAITDDDTPLHRLAIKRTFRRVFLNRPDIGGRYSAISYVGMVPAALIGIDLHRLLDRTRQMIDRCGAGVSAADNPGAMLGAVLGRAALEGRDKLTLVCSPAIAGLGSWVEQLIAESTGKQGRGIVPVEGERLGPPDVYGDDRLFIYARLDGEVDARQDAALAALEAAGQPCVRLALGDRYDVGGEFFRWEVATATAAALLGVNPFDEPNVQESKDNTKRVLREFDRDGVMPDEAPLFDGDVQLFAGGATALLVRRAESLPAALHRFLSEIGPGDYLALTAFMERTAETDKALDGLRTLLRDRLMVATTVGYGPRFLHSTGQLHKGGPPAGIFLQLTRDDASDLPVPGAPFTFSTLKHAQALGDLQSLQARTRRALRINLGTDVQRGLTRLAAMMTAE